MSLNCDSMLIDVPRQLAPLSSMARGQTALVAELVGRSDQVHRLSELGLRRGVEVEMVRPGSPCIVRFKGHTLCIRGNDLLNVLVGAEV